LLISIVSHISQQGNRLLLRWQGGVDGDGQNGAKGI
jgi:hypothetical protein